MNLPLLLALTLIALVAKTADPPRAFVDGSLAEQACNTYDPATRRCRAGTDRAFRKLAGGAAFATSPGTLVLIREGTYQEALVPAASGAPGRPITFRAYEKEAVVLSGSLDPAIDLSDRSHIAVEGLGVRDTVGWLRAVNSRHVAIRRCRFSGARGDGSRGGLTFISVRDSQIHENVLQGGHDNLLLVDSSRNLVERNLIANGRVAAWTVRCGSENVLRGNWFVNTSHTIAEIVDCDGTTDNAPRQDSAARRNLVEGNLFFYVPAPGDDGVFAGLHYGGQAGVIRGNVFALMSGPALQMALGTGSGSTAGNRVYHNIFMRTSYAAIELPAEGPSFSDNVFKNNILYGSVFKARGAGAASFAHLHGKAVQVLTGRLDGFVMERNVFFGTAPGERFVIAHDETDASMPAADLEPHRSTPRKGSVGWWQQQRPSPFVRNLEIRPLFRDELRYDVRLAAESVLIDEGAFLTRVTATGTGARMPVEDPACFVDGFGIPGVAGDEIQLEGNAHTARILNVDVAGKALDLDRPLSWRRGQGLSLKYNGKAPDPGLTDTYEPPRDPPEWQRDLTLRPAGR